MELITKIDIAEPKKRVGYGDKMMIIGSCFANEIGNILKSYGFDICVNPFGTLYNPYSVVSSLERLAGGKAIGENDVIDISLHSTSNCEERAAETATSLPKKYCSFFHHSSFAKESAEEFLASANRRIAADSEFFRSCGTIIITLGTSWVFRHIATDRIVSNCHKITPKEFVREFLPFQKSVEILNNFINEYPDKNFIFTVSPIRHLKDGAHGNQISKASLLLAIEQILKLHPNNTYYFPAYEIVLDELRDYRFYAEDMVHPSQVAVKYIFERFRECCIEPSEYQKMQQMLKRYKHESHIQK